MTWLDGPFDAGELAWRTWSEHCSVGELEVVGSDVIADREATHVRCVRTSGSVDVWVDNEAGVVLQTRGNTASVARLLGSNLGAFPASFTVTGLSFGSEAATEGFTSGAPAGADVLEADLRLRRVVAANPDAAVADLVDSSEDVPGPHPLVGAEAPQLQGTTPSGDTFDLADHRGTGVVVLWWASWCPPALESLDVIQATSLMRDDYVFVAAAFQDQPEGIRNVVDIGGITVDVVDATAHQRQWSIELCPMTFLIDPEGTVVSLLEPYDTVEDLLAQL